MSDADDIAAHFGACPHRARTIGRDHLKDFVGVAPIYPKASPRQ
jgi:hypothetical protein